MINPTIELYFDPGGRYSGKDGCFRARLMDRHGCHSAGTTPQDAVDSLLRTIASFANVTDAAFEDQPEYAALPQTTLDYDIVRLDSMYFKRMDGAWDQDEPNAARQAHEARETANLVAQMLYGNRPGRGW